MNAEVQQTNCRREDNEARKEIFKARDCSYEGRHIGKRSV